MNIELKEPSQQYEGSYRDYLRELAEGKEEPIPFVLGFECDDFQSFLAELDNCSKNIGLPEGFVPHSTYWLVSNNEVVGVSNIRHELTDGLREEGGHIGYGIRPGHRGKGYGNEILKHSLARAKTLGITKALITCGVDNSASERVILNNGGVFDSEGFVERRNEVIKRYWIDIVSL